jgi:thiol:disulfide interchange protein DsbD
MFRATLSSSMLRALCAGAALALTAMAIAAPVRTEHVEAELVAARTALVPGEPLTIALRLAIDNGWHTYWQNPGDSGLPTTLEWKLPAGVKAGPIEWPAPHLLPAGPLLNYGYENEVLHLVTLTTVPDFASGRDVTLTARADWLVCKETCIPEGADLTLTLPVANASASDPRWGKSIMATRAALPRSLAGWQASAEGRGTTIALKLTPPPGAADPGEVRYFANAIDRIEPSAPQPLARDGSGYVLTLPVATTLHGAFGNLAGVVTAANGLGNDVRAATIDVPVKGVVSAPPRAGLPPSPDLNLAVAPADAGGLALAIALASAFIGGMLLNLMPCVFPVLSLKVLGFATHNDRKKTLHHEAVAFAAGVVLTFVALGLLLSALRAAGEQLGWGFQLQSPSVVTALAILFFVLALNLSGVFEFGQLAPQAAGVVEQEPNRGCVRLGRPRRRHRLTLHGALHGCGARFRDGRRSGDDADRVRRARPRHGAPVRAPRLVPRLAQPPAASRPVARALQATARVSALCDGDLACVGAGRAAGQRCGAAALRGTARYRLCVVGLANRSWGRRAAVGDGRPCGTCWRDRRRVAVVLAGHGARQGCQCSFASAADRRDWAPFTAAQVADLTAAGRAVFVDFTAAWCVTCQVNKRLALNTDAVRADFAKRNIALVRADWTRRDPAITQALTALGRSGVPVYVLYRPGKPPLVLPEVLQQQTVLDALATL